MTTTQQPTSSTNDITKTDRPMSDFDIAQVDGLYVVTLDGEWFATFASKYRANLHVACIAA